jgi:signal transduction histidine kinase
MKSDPPPASPQTHFAPAGRVSRSELDAEVASCLNNPVAQVVLEAVESYALILNEQRQMLTVNAALAEALAQEDPTCFLGLRPGEIFGCVHVEEGPDGCGTSKACGRCGAVLTILAAQRANHPVEGECLLSTKADGVWSAQEFQVRATPLAIGGHAFLVLVLKDISAQKRREVLEQVFLHDLMNTLQGLRGWTELLQMTPESPLAAAEKIATLADHLTGEVQAQRLLLQAERGELATVQREIPLVEFFQELLSAIQSHQCATGRRLEILPLAAGLALRSDPRLLRRILLNMAINALEATGPGGTVRIQAEREGGAVRFSVTNPGLIPEAIASQIFLRSFSTKGRPGRGLGTYSMKLLGENILGGRVGFHSSPDRGTEFFLQLPDPA